MSGSILSESGLEECSHEAITDEGYCESCGLCMENNSNATKMELSGVAGESRYHACPITTVSFASDFRGIDIPEDVRGAAITLASSIPPEVHRMGVRRQLRFVLGKPFVPEELAEKVGITQSEINQAIRLVSGTSAIIGISLPRVEDCIVTAPVVIISPVNYISSICMTYGISPELIRQISEDASRILGKDRYKSLYAKKPKHVAFAFIKNFLDRGKFPIPVGFGKNTVSGKPLISGTILKLRIKDIVEIDTVKSELGVGAY
jgi:hypothetical protein